MATTGRGNAPFRSSWLSGRSTSRRSPTSLLSKRVGFSRDGGTSVGYVVLSDFYFDAVAGSTGQIKFYNGSAFVAKPVKVWNGSSWVVKPLKRWNGSSWVVTPY